MILAQLLREKFHWGLALTLVILLPSCTSSQPRKPTIAIIKPDPTSPSRTTKKVTLGTQTNQSAQNIKLDGNTARRANITVDAKLTGFGAYDRMFIDAVSACWYDLLDIISYEDYKRGRVHIEFTQHSNGRITDLKIIENSVTEELALLCRKAIEYPSPFEPWPREMQLKVGGDFRTITFTFHYK